MVDQSRKDSFKISLTCSNQKIRRYQIFWLATTLRDNFVLGSREFNVDPLIAGFENQRFRIPSGEQATHRVDEVLFFIQSAKFLDRPQKRYSGDLCSYQLRVEHLTQDTHQLEIRKLGVTENCLMEKISIGYLRILQPNRGSNERLVLGYLQSHDYLQPTSEAARQSKWTHQNKLSTGQYPQLAWVTKNTSELVSVHLQNIQFFDDRQEALLEKTPAPKDKTLILVSPPLQHLSVLELSLMMITCPLETQFFNPADLLCYETCPLVGQYGSAERYQTCQRCADECQSGCNGPGAADCADVTPRYRAPESVIVESVRQNKLSSYLSSTRQFAVYTLMVNQRLLSAGGSLVKLGSLAALRGDLSSVQSPCLQEYLNDGFDSYLQNGYYQNYLAQLQTPIRATSEVVVQYITTTDQVLRSYRVFYGRENATSHSVDADSFHNYGFSFSLARSERAFRVFYYLSAINLTQRGVPELEFDTSMEHTPGSSEIALTLRANHEVHSVAFQVLQIFESETDYEIGIETIRYGQSESSAELRSDTTTQPFLGLAGFRGPYNEGGFLYDLLPEPLAQRGYRFHYGQKSESCKINQLLFHPRRLECDANQYLDAGTGVCLRCSGKCVGGCSGSRSNCTRVRASLSASGRRFYQTRELTLDRQALRCSSPDVESLNFTLYYEETFRRVPQALFSLSLVLLDSPASTDSHFFQVTLGAVHRDRLEYQVQCSRGSFVGTVILKFLMVDLPESVEIGFLSLDIRIPESWTGLHRKFARDFGVPPRLAVFQTSIVPHSISKKDPKNRVRVRNLTASSFDLSVLSNFGYWSGYYLACVDAPPFQCDLGDFGGEDHIQTSQQQSIFYYRREFEVETDRQLDLSTYALHIGLQNLYLTRSLSAELRRLNYNRRYLFLSLRKYGFNVTAHYLTLRRLECPEGFYLSDFAARECAQCPAYCARCENGRGCSRTELWGYEGRAREQDRYLQVGQLVAILNEVGDRTIHPRSGNTKESINKYEKEIIQNGWMRAAYRSEFRLQPQVLAGIQNLESNNTQHWRHFLSRLDLRAPFSLIHSLKQDQQTSYSFRFSFLAWSRELLGGALDWFPVTFPADSRTSHRVYFSEQGVSRRVHDYLVLLTGMEYPEINQPISFRHSTLGVSEGVLFSSDVPLRLFSLRILVIYDPEIVLHHSRLESRKNQSRRIQFTHDYHDNGFLVLLAGFRRARSILGSDLRAKLLEGDGVYEAEILTQTDGESVEYEVVQLGVPRCAEGYLEFPHNQSCLAVRSCGSGFYLETDPYRRGRCRACRENCRECESGEQCVECRVEGGDPSRNCECYPGFYLSGFTC